MGRRVPNSPSGMNRARAEPLGAHWAPRGRDCSGDGRGNGIVLNPPAATTAMLSGVYQRR